MSSPSPTTSNSRGETSSLWLLPPPQHPLHSVLTELIHSSLPALFPDHAASRTAQPPVAPHFFPAHVTLTSEIPVSAYSEHPGGAQAWLEEVFARLRRLVEKREERKEMVRVRFGKVDGQDHFFRRCFIRVGFGAGVGKLAGMARAGAVIGEEVTVGEDGEVRFGEETERWLSWWQQAYGPHLSLMYGDQPVPEDILNEVAKVVRKAGVKLPGYDDDSADQKDNQEHWHGWEGGVIWLVPTYKPISEWSTPIATLDLGSQVKEEREP